MHNDYKKLVRLFVEEAPLQEGATFALSDNHKHYLRNVMRKQEGDRIRVFNGQEGEWLATITVLNKKHAGVALQEQLKPQTEPKDIWVVSSPVKKAAFDLMIEKACELGASQFLPVVCDHTVVHRLKKERLETIAIEASEQSERLTVMRVTALDTLLSVINQNPDRTFVVCLERSDAKPMVEIAHSLTGGVAVVIGPEGGFSEKEVGVFTSAPNVVIASLGEQVLRSETAMIAALAIASLV